MEVITIESKTYQDLTKKLDKILKYVEGKEQERQMYQDVLIDSEELAKVMDVSTRTIQRLRSANRISYRIVCGKCCYDLVAIEQALRDKVLYCNPKTFAELRQNFKLRSKLK